MDRSHGVGLATKSCSIKLAARSVLSRSASVSGVSGHGVKSCIVGPSVISCIKDLAVKPQAIGFPGGIWAEAFAVKSCSIKPVTPRRVTGSVGTSRGVVPAGQMRVIELTVTIRVIMLERASCIIGLAGVSSVIAPGGQVCGVSTTDAFRSRQVPGVMMPPGVCGVARPALGLSALHPTSDISGTPDAESPSAVGAQGDGVPTEGAGNGGAAQHTVDVVFIQAEGQIDPAEPAVDLCAAPHAGVVLLAARGLRLILVAATVRGGTHSALRTARAHSVQATECARKSSPSPQQGKPIARVWLLGQKVYWPRLASHSLTLLGQQACWLVTPTVTLASHS